MGFLLPLSRGWGFPLPTRPFSFPLPFLLPCARKIELPPLRFLLPPVLVLRLPLSSFHSSTGPRCSKPLPTTEETDSADLMDARDSADGAEDQDIPAGKRGGWEGSEVSIKEVEWLRST